MSRYILVRRLRGPAILLLLGILALLRQMGAIPYLWRLFWPLFLILMGLFLLAERAVLATEGYPVFRGAPWHDASQGTDPSGPFQGVRSQGTENSGANEGTAIVPVGQFRNDSEEGQS
jgi:hypothetical protein